MAQLVKISLPGLNRAEQPGFEPLSRYQRSVSSILNLVTYHIASVFILRVLYYVSACWHWPIYQWPIGSIWKDEKIKKGSPLLQKYILRRQPCFVRLSLRQMCKRFHEEGGSV